VSGNPQARIVGAALFILFLALIWLLRERDLEFIFEPDFWPEMIEAWRRFFATADPSILPTPVPHPYLDGQYVVYGLEHGALSTLRSEQAMHADRIPLSVEPETTL
jgi:hypothetical protein